MSSGDKQVYLQPGQKGLPVRAGGDFIFLKEAERPVRVLVDGQPIVMVPGAKQRIQRKEAGKLAFDDFEVDNLNDDLPQSVTFVVGVGDYDQVIITGDVKSETILRAVDGVRPDSRTELVLDVYPDRLSTQALTQGDIVEEKETVSGSPVVNDVLFPAEDGLIGYAYRQGFNGGGLFLYDADLNFVREAPALFYAQYHSDYAYSPELGYVAVEGNKVYSAAGELATIAEQCYSICYISSNNTFAVQSMEDNILFYSGDFSTLLAVVDRETNVDNQSPLRYDAILHQVVSIGSSDTRIYNPDSFELESVHGSSFPINFGSNATRAAIVQNYLIGFSSTSGGNLRKVAVIDFDTKPTFQVEGPGPFAPLLKNQAMQTTGNITVEQKETGAAVSGEIIKMLIESHYKRVAPADYLDHVYSVAMGAGVRGTPQVETNTGARTFSLEGQKDNFELYAPARVRLVLDSQITLGAFLV